MTPLQQAAHTLLDAINPQGFHKAEMLRKALEAEQVQAVEPVAWMVYVAEANNQYAVCDIDDQQLVDDCTNHNAEVTPLFTHPAPPPATGERAKVGDSRFESWYSETAISYERKQAMREAYEAGLNAAQQVAVPVPMSGYEISKWWASENGLEDCDMCIHGDFEKVVRAIEARHRIGVKP